MIEQVLSDIQRAAKRVAGKWSSITTEEDMAQALSVHFLERTGSLEKLIELSEEKRVARLIGIGHDLASGLRDDLDVFSGQFTYSVDEVRKLLDRGALDGHVYGFDSATADVEASYGELQSRNREQAKALYDRYVRDIVPKQGADQMLLTRATESLTTLMNRVSKSARYNYSNGGRYRNNRLATNQVDLDYTAEARFDEYDD